MKRLTDSEIQDIIFRNFCTLPLSEQAIKEREELIKMVCEILETRKDAKVNESRTEKMLRARGEC